MMAMASACLSKTRAADKLRFSLSQDRLLSRLRDSCFGGLPEAARTALVRGLFPSHTVELYEKGLAYARTLRQADPELIPYTGMRESVAALLVRCT